MSNEIKIQNISAGCYWIDIPQERFSIICGCPDGLMKHAKKQGLIHDLPDGFKSGPNAILLNEVNIGYPERFNLSEFAILHMIYRQSKNGLLPLVIGSKEQLQQQLQYLTYGNYGLVNEEDYLELGYTKEESQFFIAVKLYFAGNSFNLDHLITSKVLETEEIEIHPNIFIERMGNNLFYFRYKNIVKLINLEYLNSDAYCPPYTLPKTKIPKAEFAITHIGEGDGWNENLPCMSSFIQCNGFNYVLDAGPYISHSFQAINKSFNEITGFFLTHIHDDHCSSISRFIIGKVSHKTITIYSIRIIYKTLIRKLASLTGETENTIESCLNFIELQENEWNNVNGMQVKPVFSFHPVDTVFYIFSYTKNNETKTYGHFADIAAVNVLQNIKESMPKKLKPIMTQYLNNILDMYNLPLTIKKVDVGGPSIHGYFGDFKEDKSERLIFSHTSVPLTKEQLRYGEQASFGETDILF